MGLVARVLDAVAATIHVDEDDLEIYTSGATNFFKYPELSDKTKATELISTLKRNSSWLIWSRSEWQMTIPVFKYISEMNFQFLP